MLRTRKKLIIYYLSSLFISFLSGCKTNEPTDAYEKKETWEETVVASREKAIELSKAINKQPDQELITSESWYSIGPFKAENRLSAHWTSSIPEDKPADFTKKYTKNNLGWSIRPDLKDATLNKLEGKNCSYYFSKNIYVKRDCIAWFKIISGDGCKIYVDGKNKLDRNYDRLYSAGTDSVKVYLKKGKQNILIKVANDDNADFAFNFEILPLNPQEEFLENAQAYVWEKIQKDFNRSFNYTIDFLNGSISSIKNPQDKHQMNWVLEGDNKQFDSQDKMENWGMGYYFINGQKYTWDKPSSFTSIKQGIEVIYNTGDMAVTVTRQFDQEGNLEESFKFKNISRGKLNISETSIYTPFNDNYPNSETCETSRCNTHIWAGLNSTYVNAVRMGGFAPHLGLILNKGSIESYSVNNKEIKYNQGRGTIVLNTGQYSIDPNKEQVVGWKLFWHKGWDDFYAKSKNLSNSFVKVSVKDFTIEKNEPAIVEFELPNGAKDIECFINNTPTKFIEENKKVKIQQVMNQLGDQTISIRYNKNQETFAKLHVVSSIDNIIQKRVEFIANKQQFNKPGDDLDGAYLVYDNETNSIIEGKGIINNANEGRERLGMGVLIAKYLQRHKNPRLHESLMRYHNFVSTKLQDSSYYVYDGVNVPFERPYNFPWVAQLHLEVYKCTNNKKHLLQYFNTLNKFYTLYGYKFYAIGINMFDGIKTLEKAGLNKEKEILLSHMKKMGESIIKISTKYPAHEVTYEQSIVSPAVTYLCELYLLTKDERYLSEAKKQLVLLEAFGGDQPDFHLNQIAIRHWDGYWFGKRHQGGDTFPHYWSTLSGLSYYRYYQATGDQTYLQKAKTIMRNNLCLFTEDGRGSAAYLYPKKLDDIPGQFYDPWANDQDWALVHYLMIF